ncbi:MULTISPECIES: hypothetical protein [Pseudomonas syringae group]|uniref:Uncharacterized protein n=2 Tax=Pseudomonas syringae group TaxID=136849 RepID=A0AAW4E610_PSESX|nr:MULTISPECIES: hypothetical protein [Pseudomonas syringae group]AVI84086.1 hypothetical protein XJ28_10365 [Pseudomonas syringae pv. tomato]EEB57158.1 conserved hypothetical protein [Pseudomonas syringae pv. tomato T1]KGK92924.1 hypothetical protein NB04_24350 [Pseudomonas syringae pv. tomato]KUR42262.1 hypothetical protein PST407_05707 [Pseudomonas syringae pv. tomato]KUR47145.1 hypothetical protein PSTA9_01785 [Pseudomonas syringae pv. tomato]
MSSQATRDKLISIIKEHQLSHGQTKLPVLKLAELAGISRQAFNRYYDDLKAYSTGKESIAKLLVDDNASLSEIIENNEARIFRLEQEIASTKAAHQAELDSVILNHTTTLMNNDIIAFNANQLSSTLTNQSNHNAFMRKRLTELEVTNAKLTIDAVTASSASSSAFAEKSDKNFITFDLDLTLAKKSYALSKNFSSYEDAKDLAITKAISDIRKFPTPESLDIIFFQDKYISDFNLFCSRLSPRHDRTLIIVRLPIYSREEIQIILKDMHPLASVSIHVPHSSSDAIISAKRKFSFRDIPVEELQDADSAKTPLITWGFESVVVSKIRQGD